MRSKSLLRQSYRNLQIIRKRSKMRRTSKISRTNRAKVSKSVSTAILLCQSFDRQDAASGYRHDPARLCFFRVIEIADVLAHDLDVGRVFQKPAHSRDFNGARFR